MVDISIDRKVGGVVSYFHCVIFLLLDRLALIHYTRFRSTIPWHGRPWVEHGVTKFVETLTGVCNCCTHMRHPTEPEVSSHATRHFKSQAELLVMLYFAISILVRSRIVQFWYVPELFITCSNSRTYQNCAISLRTRIVRLYNSGTRFLPELLLQFWDVPELFVNYLPIACWITP